MKRVILAAAVAALSFVVLADAPDPVPNPEPGVYTSDSYAQPDHLVAFWDGLENAGVGQSSRSATTWTDLSGHGFDWTLIANRYEWTERGFRLKGLGQVGSLVQTATDFENKVSTIEFVYANRAEKNGIIFSPGFNDSTYLYTDASGMIGFYGPWRQAAQPVGTTVALNATNCFSVVYTRTEETARPTGVTEFKVNGVATEAETVPNAWLNMTSPIMGDRGDSNIPANGELFALRIYDTVLTDAEREQNRQTDFARYVCGVRADLEFTDNRFGVTLDAAAEGRTLVLCSGGRYVGTNGWTTVSDPVVLGVGETAANFAKPSGWGKTEWYARVKVVQGDLTYWSKTVVASPAPPVGVDETLALASSAVGSSEIVATVTGIGVAASATLTFKYGTASNVLDGTVAVSVDDEGEWRGHLPHLVSGQAYFVKAVLSNGIDQDVESEVFDFVQPAVVEPGVYTSDSYAQASHLVAFWDGLDNAGVGQGSRSATTWTDLSGHGFDWTLASGKYEWTERGLRLKGSGLVGTLAQTAADFENKVSTVEFVYANKAKSNGIVFSPGFDLSLYLYVDGSGRVGFWGSNSGTVGTTVALNATNRFSVVYARPEGTARPTGVDNFKVNGVGTSAESMANIWYSLTTPLLGARGDGAIPANGELFALRIYDTVLTDAEREQNQFVDLARYEKGLYKPVSLRLVDGQLVATVSASDAEQTVVLCWDEVYCGTNAWEHSTSLPVAAGETTAVFRTPAGWGSTVWYARARIGEGGGAIWSRTVVAPPPAAPGVEKPTLASSAFGSSEIAAQVTGIGKTASEATLMFAYGSTPDAADGEVEVPVAGPGEWRGTIPHLACGVTYYVKATLSNDVNEVVTSDVFTFVQPEVMEPGNGSSASYFTTGLVAQWDGIDNVIADGKATHSTTPDKWYDLSGNGNDATFSSPSKLVWEDDGWTNDNDSRPAYAPSAAISAMADKEFTVEFLVKPATTTTRRTFLGQYSAADFGIEHNSSSKSDGGIRLYYGNPDIYAPASDIKVCQDVVSSVAYTTSGGEHKLYLNGAHVFTKTGSAIPNGRPNSGQQMVIGGEPSRGGMSFRGKFYTMRIYDRALSADEVARNYRVDAARYCGVGNVLLPLTQESGRLVLTASASGASRTAYLFADETYGGVDGWGEPVETVTLPAGATSVSFATPEGWGKSVWFARAQVADTGREIWSATVVAADADLPSTTLADARAIGTDKLVLSGSLNSFVGGSCTLTPVVTDSSGAAIDFLSESLTLDAPGEFAFTLAGAGLPAEGETYTVCVEAKAGGKASRSVTRTLVVGTAGALTPLDPGAEAPVEVAVESRPGSLTTVSPVYGRYAAAENKVYSFSAPTSATADGRVYSLAGYEVYDEGGDEPVVSGTNNVFTFATDRGGFRVVWKWNVLYATELTVSGGHGTAVAQQSAVAHGGTAQFTASPETGYAVVWSGDVPNEKIFGNELVLESVEGPLNVTATFFVPSPTEGPETGLFADYTNAVSVTFAGYEGVETLKEFTALIRLSEGKGGFSYNDCAFTDGRDVRFCDATGNELASEIVTWNPNGTSEVWVKVPELAGRKTRIFMVWGNENATARPQTMCAWDCATIGAWGLEDTKGAVLDGSLKGHHGVCNPAVVTSVKGVVGSARRFNGTEYATIGVRDAWTLEPSNLTASCWFRYDTLPGNKGTGLFTSTRLNNNGGQGCALLLNADGCVHGTHNGYTFSNSVKTEKPVSAGEWHQAVLTTSIPATGNASSQLFVDGRFVAAYSRAFSSNPVWWGVFGVASAFPVIGGSYVNEAKYYFNGDVDETQLAAEVRSADWIRASYLTVASNDTFAVFGADDTSFTVTGDEVLPVAAGLVPAAGRGLLAPQIEATAPASYVQGGTRWTATGWAVVADGKKIAAGEGNSVSCAWPAGAKAVAVNWSWTKEHRISVDGVSTWVADGGVFKVTAPAAQTDKAFHSWEGDCPETETFSDAFDLGVDGPKTLTSVFADRTYVEGGDTQGLVDAVAAVKDKAEPHVIVLGDGAFGPAATCTATGPLVIRSANGTGSTTVTNVSLTCFSMNNRRAAFKDLTFVMRKVGGNGAKLATGIFNLVDCVVEGDGDTSAPDDRRAFYLTSNGVVYRTVFRNLYCGGNILATQYRVLVDSCVFTNNHVSAAPVTQSYRGLVVRNSVFADNVPLNNNRHDGGAMTFDNTETLGQMVENCTFVDNRNNATTTYGDNSRGGAVRVKSPTLVLNTLFSGNAAGSDVDGNDFYGLVAGVCSLSAQFGEEGFADSAAVRCLTGEPAFVEDDPLYRVTSLSPARNAGLATPAARDAAARDIAGTNRVNEGAIDIGASEFYDSGDEEFAVLVEADVASGRDTLTVGFTAKVGGAKGEVTYAWDFGDGEMSDGPNPSHTYAKPGYYTLTLTVTDGTTHETATFTRESFIKILPSTCYVNAAGSHEDPYATPETGAASILDVIALTPSKIVICANSTSDKKNDGTLCKIEFPVEVIGEDPATSVLADRVHLNHASAVLRDLTCTVTSKGDSSGSGPFQVTGGLVSNVTFTGCTPSPNSNSSREVLKLFEGGRVVDSRFVRNNITAKGQRMDTTPGNVAIGIYGKGALVDRCVVTNNFGGTEKGAFAAGIRVDGNYSPAPVIRNTLIADNQCFGPYPTNTVGGAGIYAKGSVVVESCTIATNRTSGAGAAIYVTAGTAEFVNTIVAANVGGLTNAAETCSNEVFVASGAAATWTNCRVPAEAGVSGEGVTTAEPKFNLGVRRSEPYWALRGTSPLKNKGVSLGWMGGESDLSGKPRVFEKKPDLGCYENQIGGTVLIVR